MTCYSEELKQLQPNYDPRHIEAYIRLEYSTLNHLSADTLRREADIAAGCIDVRGAEHAEALAQSFGL
ncbi:MAG TPA: hypothetical protein VFM97_00330 [Gammaproteobacteria bacterium]|nr:hypothetical protein [Gammaproteobacteria bacterium]